MLVHLGEQQHFWWVSSELAVWLEVSLKQMFLNGKFHLVMKWLSSYAYCFTYDFRNIFLHSKPMWCVGIWQYWVSDVFKTSTFFCNYIQQVCFSYFMSILLLTILVLFPRKKTKISSFSHSILFHLHTCTRMRGQLTVIVHICSIRCMAGKSLANFCN